MKTKKYCLAPSILSADFMHLKEQTDALSGVGADFLHFDVMDGSFVPSISFGTPVLKCLRRDWEGYLDVHLMVVKPEKHIPSYAELGANHISFHYEAVEDPESVISMIRSYGIDAGMAISPDTPIEKVRHLMPLLDLLLIMTVEPGAGGQTCIPACLDKLREAKRIVEAEGLSLNLEVDGGVRQDNLGTIVDAGANIIVAGSAVFHGDVRANAKALMSVIEAHRK